jgi:hypothetical protein
VTTTTGAGIILLSYWLQTTHAFNCVIRRCLFMG